MSGDEMKEVFDLTHEVTQEASKISPAVRIAQDILKAEDKKEALALGVVKEIAVLPWTALGGFIAGPVGAYAFRKVFTAPIEAGEKLRKKEKLEL